MIQPIKIIAIFVYRLNQEQSLYPWVLECDPWVPNKTLKSLSIMDNKTIFKNQDIRLVRDIMPDPYEKPMVVYHLYIREDSKMRETYADAAKELGYTYMDTDEYNGTYTPGSNYDHYYKFI